MKICIVVGGRWHAPEVARAFEGLGHDVLLVSPRTRLVQNALKLGGRFRAAAPALHAGFSAAVSRTVRAYNPHLVLAWSSFGLAEVLRSSQTVVLVRGSHHIQRQRNALMHTDEVPTRLMVKLEEYEYARAEIISVPTPEIAQDPAWGTNRVRVKVSPYGFPPLQERPASVGDRVVLFVGAGTYRKGFDRLVAAFRFPSEDYKFRYVGPLPRNQQSLPSHWDVYGLQNHGQVLAHMTESSVLVVPSREEGMARVGQEALACGLPVVATEASGLSTWLVDGAGVILDDEAISSHGLIRGVHEILGDFSRRSALAHEVAATWSWEDHASLILAQAEGEVG